MKTSSKIWMCLAGVALVALGVVCLLNPGDTIITLAWAIGLILLFTGCFNCAEWFIIGRHLPQRHLIMFTAIIEIILGIVLVINPVGLALALPFLFAGYVLFEGLSLSLESFDFKHVGFKYWYCLLILGLGGIALGIYGLFYNPTASATILSTLVSVGIIVDGVGYWIKLAGINQFEKHLKKLKDRIEYVDAEVVE
ncbi:MAG: DUF308 domain-containing protein [Paludibacteraceae bacterium]|nr:DUF308 domain-containing protein [Paludibacteraceae bacterium]